MRLLDEVGVDIHFTNVVDDDGKLDALLVLQYAVQQGGLAATQVACQQQDGNVLNSHFQFVSFLYSIFLLMDFTRRARRGGLRA